MLRVLETIRRSPEADNMLVERLELTAWINEILTNAWAHQVRALLAMSLEVVLTSFCSLQHPNGTLFNYIDQDESTTFADTSGTALLAAVTYRMATLSGELDHISSADDAFKLIQDSLTDDGWLLNTVDPLTFNSPSAHGSYSPEGQAFVLLLQAAWRDFAGAYDNERR